MDNLLSYTNELDASFVDFLSEINNEAGHPCFKPAEELDFFDTVSETYPIYKPSKAIGERVFNSFLENLEKVSGTREPQFESELLYIAQFTGDDEIVLTNNNVLGPMMLAVTTEILKLKISWKDVGQSKYIANYAEEWILIPFRDEMSFSFVEKYHKRDGVPYTLDSVKCKMLSPVRKQSKLELDLESKFSTLAVAAKWVNPNWFTYDFHQTALVLAMEIFDFSSESKFPFLGKEDGGIGANPPYNNFETLESYMFAFNRGKSSLAIQGVMKEVVEIYQGRRKGSEAFFLRSLQASRSSEEIWQSYVSAYRTLIEKGQLSDLEIRDLVSRSLEIELPYELEQKAIIFEPRDYATASIISNLRTSGLIMTETDVKMYEASLEKFEALRNKNETFGEYLKRKEAEERLLKSQPLKILTEIAKQSQLTKVSNEDLVAELNEKDLKYETFRLYFKIKNELFFSLTSFHYSGKIRLFKAKDVQQFYHQENHKGFVETLMRETFEKPLRSEFKAEERFEQNWNAIREWLEEPNPFLKPLPVGIGADDARISIQILGKLLRRDHIFVLISNDKQLGMLIATLVLNLNRMREEEHEFFSMDVEAYIALCKSNRNQDKGKGFYNCVTGLEIDPPKDYDDLYSHETGQRKSPIRHRLFLLYDFPNIERTAHSIENNLYRWVRVTGGFLSKKTLEEIFQGKFPIWPLNELRGDPVFQDVTEEFKPRIRLRRRQLLWNNWV